MKTSLILITTAVAVPASIMFGMGTSAAFSTAVIIGVAAMLTEDYGRAYSIQPVLSGAKRVETNPLAA